MLEFVVEDYVDSLSDAHEAFVASIEHTSILQHPCWLRIIYPESQIRLFYLKQENNIVAFASTIERYKIVKLLFGPLTNSVNHSVEILHRIKEYYSKSMIYLEVQPAFMNENDAAIFREKVADTFHSLKKEDIRNWSTLRTSLLEDISDIQSRYSENHRRSVKNAIKEGYQIKKLTEVSQIKTFAKLYDSMYSRRNLTKPHQNSEQLFTQLFNFFNKIRRGKFLGVFTKENVMIGGVCLAGSGNVLMYRYGATDNKNSKAPILHLAFHEALQIAKEAKYTIFDFGGYNRYVDKKDQVHNINIFKKGFRGEIVDFAPKMYFIFNKPKYWLYQWALSTYRRCNRFYNHFILDRNS